MPLHLEAEPLDLHTKHPFLIARGGQAQHRTIWVRLRDGDGAEGWGEAAATTYYGETPETVLAALSTYVLHLPDDPAGLERAERALEAALGDNPSARAALSAALHDLVGKRLGVPVWKLWGLDPTTAPPSTFTIGLDSPEKMRAKVVEAEPYPILKVKLGTHRDGEILRAIRSVTEKELRVDANAAWTRKAAIAMLPVLREFGVTVLEQPLPPHDLDGLAAVTRASSIPVIADESCLIASDIPRLVGAVDGINIKLAKCGSLREALRMIAVARAHGMMVMVGCMIESSIGITAAAHFTPLVDLVDLDGAALLSNDPFAGATIDGGRVTLPTAPGLGVRRR
ncbi:MAG TPA: dipeptide epimerase [Gemmatimonadales bacterium]|jgi:L-alanine-DL-glutamate epimerase-like enolase superfamily enzyme|nr:dipeptide epimerase [Gemmatimonadales bacterium]